MYKMKWLICSLLSVSLIYISAVAEILPPPVVDDTGLVTVEGQSDILGYGDSVSLTVIRPQREDDATDYTTADLKTILKNKMLASFSQHITDSQGRYTACFSLKDEDPGYYTMVVSNSKTDEIKSSTFYFSTLGNKLNFINEIDLLMKAEGSSYLDLKNKLSTDGTLDSLALLFGIDAESEIFSVDLSGLTKVLFERLKINDKISQMTPEEFVNELTFSAHLRSVCEGKVNIYEYKEELSLDGDFVKTYDEKLSASKKSVFTEYFKNHDIFFKKDAQDLFCESVIKSIISQPNGWNDYKFIADNHGQYLEGKGFNLSKYKNLSASKKAKLTDYLKSSYEDLSVFVSDMNKAITSVEGGGSGGSGGLGGSLPSTNRDTGIPSPVIIEGESSAPITSPTGVFSDISSVEWANESIIALYKMGVINGVEKGKFDPDGNITREQFVKMVVLGFGIESAENGVSFEDVKSDQWYSKYIHSAVNSGIIFGVSESRFGLGESITRQDAAVILGRIAKRSGKELSTDGEVFADDAQIAQYAKEYVYALKAGGILSGMPDGSFSPDGALSRAQAAKMIYGLITNMK